MIPTNPTTLIVICLSLTALVAAPVAEACVSLPIADPSRTYNTLMWHYVEPTMEAAAECQAALDAGEPTACAP